MNPAQLRFGDVIASNTGTTGATRHHLTGMVMGKSTLVVSGVSAFLNLTQVILLDVGDSAVHKQGGRVFVFPFETQWSLLEER